MAEITYTQAEETVAAAVKAGKLSEEQGKAHLAELVQTGFAATPLTEQGASAMESTQEAEESGPDIVRDSRGYLVPRDTVVRDEREEWVPKPSTAPPPEPALERGPTEDDTQAAIRQTSKEVQTLTRLRETVAAIPERRDEAVDVERRIKALQSLPSGPEHIEAKRELQKREKAQLQALVKTPEQASTEEDTQAATRQTGKEIDSLVRLREAVAAEPGRQGELPDIERRIKALQDLPTGPDHIEAKQALKTTAEREPEPGPVKDETEQAVAFRQVQAAVKSGVAVSKTVLERAGVAEQDTARILREQKAQAELAEMPGVKSKEGFDLPAAIQGGASLELIANAGFMPDDIDRAYTAHRREQKRQQVFSQVEAALASGATVSDKAMQQAGIEKTERERILKQQEAFAVVSARLAGGETVTENQLKLAGVSTAERKRVLEEQEANRFAQEAFTRLAAKLEAGETVTEGELIAAGVEPNERSRILSQQEAFKGVSAKLEAGDSPTDREMKAAGIPMEEQVRIRLFERVSRKLEAGETVTAKELDDAGVSETERTRILKEQEDTRQAHAAEIFQPEPTAGTATVIPPQSQEQVAARKRVLGILNKTSPENAATLRGGGQLDLVTALDKGIDPADLATLRFRQTAIDNAAQTVKDREQLRVSITAKLPPQYETPFLETGKLNLYGAFAAGVTKAELKTYGFDATVVDTAYAEWRKARTPLEGAAAAPKPTVMGEPPPSGRFPVPDELNQALKNVETQEKQFARSGGLAGASQLAELGTRRQAIKGIIAETQAGNLTPADATEQATAIATASFRPITGREAAMLVPGLGTFLSYQDAQRSGFSPVEVGFFAFSAGMDLLIFYPAARGALALKTIPLTVAQKAGQFATKGAGVVLRPVAQGVAAATRSAATATGRVMAFPKVQAIRTIAQGEAGFIKIGEFAKPKPLGRGLSFSPEELAKAGFTKAPAAVPPKRPPTVTTKVKVSFTPEERAALERLRRSYTAPENAPVTIPKIAPKPLPAPKSRVQPTRYTPPTDPGRRPGPADWAKEKAERLRQAALDKAREEIDRLNAPGIRSMQEYREQLAKAAADAKRTGDVKLSVKPLPTFQELIFGRPSERAAQDATVAAAAAAVTQTQQLTASEVTTLGNLLTQTRPLTKTEAETLTRLTTKASPLTHAEVETLTRLAAKTAALTQAETRTLAKAFAKPEGLTQAETKTLTELATKLRAASLTATEAQTLTQLLTRAEPTTATTTKTSTRTKAGIQTRPETTTQGKTTTRPETAVQPKTTTAPKTTTTPGVTIRTPPPGKVRTPPPRTPPRTPPPPGKVRIPPPLPPFKLPGGKQLKPGTYPRTIQWEQGLVLITRDLQTHKTRYQRLAVPSTKHPSSTLKVLTTDTTPPRRSILDIGAFLIDVSPRQLVFRRDRKGRFVDRSFRRPRGRLA